MSRMNSCSVGMFQAEGTDNAKVLRQEHIQVFKEQQRGVWCPHSEQGKHRSVMGWIMFPQNSCTRVLTM